MSVNPVKEEHPLNALRRMGTVTSVANAPATITVAIGGDATNPDELPYLESYNPTVNDTVVLLTVQGDSIVVGAMAPAPWLTYTPILKSFTSGLTVSTSSSSGHYKVMGKTIFVQGELTASALAAQATVSLPLAGSRRFLNCGSMVCFGTTTPADQSYCARMLDGSANSLILVGTTGGFRDLASGSSLDWSITYELP